MLLIRFAHASVTSRRDAPPDIRLKIPKNILLLAVGAFLYTIACPPYDWSSAAWVTLTPFFLVLRHGTLCSALLTGLLFGVLSCAGIGYWIYVATTHYFSLSFPFDILLTLVNYAYFVGVYFALAGGAIHLLLRNRTPLLRALGVPAAWVASELARAHGIAGIPWELLGYTQYRHLTLIQVADFTGVYGISFLAALSSHAVAEILAPHDREDSFLRRFAMRQPFSNRGGFPWLPVSIFAVSLLATLLYGSLRLRHYSGALSPSSSAVSVAVVHGGIPSSQHWQRDQQGGNLVRYITTSRRGLAKHSPDLVVWPEFALGFYLDQEPTLRAQLSHFTASVDAALLVGAPRRTITDFGTQVYNSVYLLSPEGQILSTYDKQRLIPFAEYLPPAFSWLRTRRPEGPNDFTPGSEAVRFPLPQTSFGVAICYEIIYPSLVRSLVRNGSQFLVNLSNDSWGAREGAAAQHFSMAVLRAVEYRRPLVRAATAGISGFVEPSGRPYGLLRESDGISVGKLFPHQEMTVYARYGDWFAVSCMVLTAVALFQAWRPTDKGLRWS